MAPLIHITVVQQPDTHMAKHASHPRLEENEHGYHTIIWCENGRSKRKSTGTKDAWKAQRFFADWLNARHLPAGNGGKWNCGELLDQYFSEVIEGGPSADRTLICVTNLKNFCGGMTPNNLDAGTIRRYIRERAEGLHGKRKAGDSCVRRELTVLIAALNHAVRQNRLRHDDFLHIHRPDDGDACTTVIPEDHMAEIEAAATGRLKTFFMFASETAARRNAVETLTWPQVRANVKRVLYSGGSTTKRRVPVPMSQKLLDYVLSINPDATRNACAMSGYVLGDSRSIYPAWVELMGRLAKRTGDESYLEYTPHDLRRTWATNAARRGVPMFEIAGVLGDSLAIVTKHYAIQNPDYLSNAIS